MNNKRISEVRVSDYKVEDGLIPFKGVAENWSQHIEFFENQLLAGTDTDGCEFFTGQESFDAQMDILMATLPAQVVSQIDALGFLDTGNDGQKHFHSSPRFLQVCSGVGQSGASMPQVWDTMRSFGCIPWTDLPSDPTLSVADYFAPIPQNLLDKGKQFLSLLGGKQAIQYQWIIQGQPKNLQVMQTALGQAPLCLGIAVTDSWNQQIPTDPAPGEAPQHAVMAYAIVVDSTSILDHYAPYYKVLDSGYAIPYVLQGIVSYIAPVEAQIVQDSSEVVKDATQLPPQEENPVIEAVEKVLEEIETIL